MWGGNFFQNHHPKYHLNLISWDIGVCIEVHLRRGSDVRITIMMMAMVLMMTTTTALKCILGEGLIHVSREPIGAQLVGAGRGGNISRGLSVPILSLCFVCALYHIFGNRSFLT